MRSLAAWGIRRQVEEDKNLDFVPHIETGFDWTANDENSLPQPKKDDGRLHPDYLLYCEGLEKPVCRGMLHLVTSLILPFGLWHLVREANRHQLGMAAASIYTVSNIYCYGTSALYHVGKWSPRIEILLQKLDHCGIALLSVGTFIPVTFLLFPFIYSAMLITILLLLCGWTCWHILCRNNSSVLRQVLVPASSLLFLPIFCTILTRLELILYFLVIAFQLCGVMVFTRGRPNPLPGVVGHHEMFHLFVVAAGCAVYIINWSIIRRVCRPFSHDLNVLEVLAKGVRSLGTTP